MEIVRFWLHATHLLGSLPELSRSFPLSSNVTSFGRSIALHEIGLQAVERSASTSTRMNEPRGKRERSARKKGRD